MVVVVGAGEMEARYRGIAAAVYRGTAERVKIHSRRPTRPVLYLKTI